MSFAKAWIASIIFVLPLGPVLPLCVVGAGPLFMRIAAAVLITGTIIIAPIAIATSLSDVKPAKA